jgi:hypothetical protein
MIQWSGDEAHHDGMRGGDSPFDQLGSSFGYDWLTKVGR